MFTYSYIHLLGSECILYSFNLERNQTSRWLHRRVNQKNIPKSSSQQQKKLFNLIFLVYASLLVEF